LSEKISALLSLRKKEKNIVTTTNIKVIIQININLLTHCMALSFSSINELIIEISASAVNPEIIDGNDYKEICCKNLLLPILLIKH